MEYGYQRIVSKLFDQVDSEIRELLMKEGFGIITEINIKSTFKEKLNIDYNRFKILGACNPILAEKALNLQSEVAMLMPCNLVFWENIDSSVTISVINAEKQLNVTKNRDLIILGQDVDRMLRNAVDAL
tara:strand:- start:172 stop:558 length:387 start_codon:yes stop_codon:yes gene_type:complete